MRTTHSYKHVGDTDLHWVELESARSERPPVVLLHGLSDSHLAWKHVAPVLAADRRVLMPDLPGHGLSGRPDSSYALEWHAETIGQWMQTLDLDEVDVVGHSFGGGVAQMLLLQPENKIRRVVLASSGGLGREIAWLLKLAATPLAVEHLGQPFMKLGTRLALRSDTSIFDAEDTRVRCAMNARSGTARAFSRTVRDIIDWRGQKRTFFARAHEVAQLPPIALYWGESDGVIPLRQAREFLEQVQGVELTSFRGCGHNFHGERPAEFAEAVRAFLNEPNVAPARLRAATPRRPLWAT